MRVDEGLEEIGIASLEESNAAGEHGMCQTVVPITFVPKAHIQGHVFVFVHACVCVCVGGATVYDMETPEAIDTSLSK